MADLKIIQLWLWLIRQRTRGLITRWGRDNEISDVKSWGQLTGMSVSWIDGGDVCCSMSILLRLKTESVFSLVVTS